MLLVPQELLVEEVPPLQGLQVVVVVVVVVVVEAQAGFVVVAAAGGDRCLWTQAATVPEGGVLL